MLAQLLSKHGLQARVEAAASLSVQSIARLTDAGVALACLSYLDAESPAHMRHAVRRLRRKMPQAEILLGCWVEDMDATTAAAVREAARADRVATNLRGALVLCLDLASTKAIDVSKEPIAISAA